MAEHRPNALAESASPYLLQHARNPVDWRPWGEAAFAEARRRDVPIFLSIGYSTCYWCHVMERESFENDAIAAILNANFVCVKVDREQRPDVDDIYMAATLIMNGHGGWPMTVFVEPQGLRPFYCGTYFPPVPRSGLPSLPQLAKAMSEAWRGQRAQVEAQAEAVAEAVREQITPARPALVGRGTVQKAASTILSMFDRTKGGFGGAPKFPQPCLLDLLLEARAGAGDEATALALDEAIGRTLDRMAVGGLFDQIGGGFHRYCVDGDWTVPHFEKMLYDNALLASLYARAAERYGNPWYGQIARRTCDFLERELRLSGGGFGSALDAEVAGREGETYLWTLAEVREALAQAGVEPEDVEWALGVYGLSRGPNFRDPHHPEAPACNVPRLDDRPDRLARTRGGDVEEFEARLDRLNHVLLQARGRRAQPARDDTVITAWNALAVIALCDAARAVRDPILLDRALALGVFLRDHLMAADGLPLRSRRGDRPGPAGVLEDAGSLAWAFARLGRERPHEGGAWLETSRTLIERTRTAFVDGQGGLLDARPDQAPELFIPARSFHDGAMPSGHALFLRGCLELAEASGEAADRAAAVQVLNDMSGAIVAAPASSPWGVLGLLRMLRAGWVVDASENEPEARIAEPVSPPPVEVWAAVERVTITREAPALVPVMLRIAPGHHLIAGDPGDGAEALDPLRVGVINGGGVRAYVDYPPGAEVAGMPGVRAYEGAVEMTIVLEREGDWSGTPLLAIRYQVCTGQACLAPAMLELDVALDAG